MDPTWNPDVSVADWIAPRLLDWMGFEDGVRVCSQVPTGYDAYLRLLHPIGSGTWREACVHLGKVFHPLVQWTHVAAGRPGRSCPPADQAPHYETDDPADGSLDSLKLAILVDVLRSAAPASADVVNYGLWNGFGASQSGPTLALPGRDYHLFTGPLTVIDRWAGIEFPQSPNLMWPDDRSWFLATEIDWDFTLVGGSEFLIATIEAEPGLETVRVQPEDDLCFAGDTINAPA